MLCREDILLDDPLLVALSKPAGLATIPGRAETTSVLEQLAAMLGLACSGSADPRLRVVHRLDKDTSGVLLFAKTLDAQRHLSHQFQNNRIEKQYLALVAGAPPADEGQIDAPLAVHPTQKDRMTVWKRGRPARTDWQLAERFKQFSLLAVFPRTGKTHQIRVHLQSIGLPLAIDPLYNPKAPPILLSSFKRGYRAKRGQEERPLIERLTLHAQRLSFDHPTAGATSIEAPLPKDFRTVLNMLRKYGGGRR